MSRFFINRPIVAMVISIVTVIVGIVCMLGLPVAQYPNIVPPQIQVQTTYVGADAKTIAESVATPIEQQMSGVDNMDYMYSISANNGSMTLNTFFDVASDPTTDQILAQMRQTQAQAQLPTDVRNYGITVQKATSSPLVVFALYSPDERYDATFLANYAYININNPMLRINGISQVMIFGAGEYAMRVWLAPDRLAKLNITASEVINAVTNQNTVNPAGQIGAEPVPAGQLYTYTVIAKGRLVTPAEFGEIVIRANPDGSLIRVKDVATVQLGSQVYNMKGRFNGKPAAVIAVYQLPGSNALDAANGAKKLMEQMKASFPTGIDYTVALDTTLAVTEGMKEIVKTLFEALALVILVVFIFLQGWRATLIPLMAVPVALIGVFAIFPLLGFSINTLSLFGLVLAIGLVVDDAIVVVEAVEAKIEQGLKPKEATLAAMEEVGGPVIAIALVLSAVFVPTIFIPGITGRMYQQFAVVIAVSVILSAFNALTLSPALAAMLLREKHEGHGPLGIFFRGFNRVFGMVTDRYVGLCGFLIRKALLTAVLLGAITAGAGFLGVKLPGGFIPEEDQGYYFAITQLPNAASLQRTDQVCRQMEDILMKIPGVEYVTTVVGYNLLSSIQVTYGGMFFVALKEWADRKAANEQINAIMRATNVELSQLPAAVAIAFPPPAIPGIGTAGGVTFMLEDRSGGSFEDFAQNVEIFMNAARKRPEIGSVNTTLLPWVPQLHAEVDLAKALKQGVQIQDVYETLQAFLGGVMVNYFNRFGLQWQVYVQAQGEFRDNIQNINMFYVRNVLGQPVPLASIVNLTPRTGPEFIMRYNLFQCAQINAAAAPGFSTDQATRALEEVFRESMPSTMGFDYAGMSYQEQQARQGVPPTVIFGLSLLFVFLILAAQYESWSLPFSVLLSTPVAVFGAFLALAARGMENNLYAQIGLVMLIGLAAKNAILIVEFARAEYEKGKPLMEAALTGARIRLRPILMTAFAFILGCVPLWIASGSGAVSRQNLGTAVIGGMLAATLIAVFIVPFTFYIVERATAGMKTPEPAPAPQSAEPITG